MKKTKEESSSSGARKKKASSGSGKRLNDMLESMQKRSSPVNAHKVATKYFDDFKKVRQIPENTPEKSASTEVGTGEATAVDSAVVTGKEKKRGKKSSPSSKYSEDPLLNRSENRVYSTMYRECLNKKTDSMRFGLKELKEWTGLSDKTIRVAIHSLEKKMNIKVVEPSLGIYGRKFRVLTPDEVVKERGREGVEIDSTTKKVVA